MSADPTAATPRIFLISFNKCGTGSFQRLFLKSGIASIHHHLSNEKHARLDPAVNVAVVMLKNFMLARDPLTGMKEYTAFTDLAFYSDTIIVEGGRLYPYLHQHYPDAYFILATRDVEAWVRSRMDHGGGNLAARTAAALGGVSLEAVAEAWRRQFADHNAEARRWFSDRPAARFLEFDLDADAPEKIEAFLAPDYRMKTATWQRINVTSDKTRARAEQRRAKEEPGDGPPLHNSEAIADADQRLMPTDAPTTTPQGSPSSPGTSGQA